MVDAEEVEDRGVEVVDVDLLIGRDDVVTVVVGGAPGEPAPHASPSHEHGEAAGVMIAAVIGVGERPLGVDRAAKLSAPHHECLVQQSTLIEIGEQEGGWILLYQPYEAFAMRSDIRWNIPTALLAPIAL